MRADEFDQPPEHICIVSRAPVAGGSKVNQIKCMLHAGEPFEEPHEFDRSVIDDSPIIQFSRDALWTGLVHFVERNQRVIMFFARDAGLIKNAGQHLAMIQTNREVTESKRHQCIAGRRDQFGFNHHRPRPQHINIALIEFAKAPACRAIGAPHGLNLIALEEFREFILVLRNNTRQWDREIVTQREVSFTGFFVLTTLEDFED